MVCLVEYIGIMKDRSHFFVTEEEAFAEHPKPRKFNAKEFMRLALKLQEYDRQKNEQFAECPGR